MNKALTLSLIIPAYNEEHHLKDCLDSIAAQTVMPDEVLVIDNNSTDRTVTIASSYPFVKVIHEPKQGVIHVRNTGFDTAAGEIIGRIDADTLLSPAWVERIKELFGDDELAAVTGPMYFYDMPLQEDNAFAEHFFKGSLYKYDKNFPFLAGNNMAIRKSAWNIVKEHTCSKKTIHEDIDLAIHLSRGGHKILYDAELRAGTSARRYDDPPIKFVNYMKMMTKTFKHHQMNPVGAHIAEAAYSLGYVSLWPLRRSYNPKTKKRSLKQLIKGNKPRKNPMDD
jgi:glycosyltransferase involved in cell wall biosynthesis